MIHVEQIMSEGSELLVLERNAHQIHDCWQHIQLTAWLLNDLPFALFRCVNH
ncbi:hypothetical protein D3C74_469920 [compost metagenome]